MKLTEEDIVMDSLHRGLLIPVTSKEECKQLKQQILQDHEDAKALKTAIPMIRDLRLTIVELEKDRQIVKRLEERIEELKDPKGERSTYDEDWYADMIIENLQKILEDKN